MATGTGLMGSQGNYLGILTREPLEKACLLGLNWMQNKHSANSTLLIKPTGS
jgi:hypothetical protein